VSRTTWFLSEGWRGLWHHRPLTLTALASVTGALFAFALFLLVTANARVALSTLGDRREVVAFLRDSADPADVKAIVDLVDSTYGHATFVSREQAWDEFAKELGGTELLEAVGQNPLPASIRIKLRPEAQNFASIEGLADSLMASTAVEEVRFGGEWVRRLDQFIASLLRWNLIVGVAVALGVLILIANTIRLTMIARADIFRTMALVGAGPGFIRAPLLFEGMLAAFLAALLALALLFAVWWGVNGRPLTVVFLPWTWSLAFVGAAVLLGLVGSLFALVPVTRKH
jgi:cell division transport system permease protein